MPLRVAATYLGHGLVFPWSGLDGATPGRANGLGRLTRAQVQGLYPHWAVCKVRWGWCPGRTPETAKKVQPVSLCILVAGGTYPARLDLR